MKKRLRLLILLILVAVISGCSTALTAQPDSGLRFPTPTIHAQFGNPRQINQVDSTLGTLYPDQPVASDPFVSNVAGELLPSRTPLPTATWMPTSATASPNARMVAMYTDQLERGWEVVSPNDTITANVKSAVEVHSGNRSIAISPQTSHGKLYIVSTEANDEIYERTQVYGVSLWLYSGELGLDPYDLALTMIGSNVYTYWRADDDSVESKTPYEETFLRYLGYEDKIPPNTWAEVSIWLDEMRFDPDYTYVTGLYLTNRKGFTRTFYVDDVVLMMRPDVPQLKETGVSKGTVVSKETGVSKGTSAPNKASTPLAPSNITGTAATNAAVATKIATTPQKTPTLNKTVPPTAAPQKTATVQK